MSAPDCTEDDAPLTEDCTEEVNSMREDCKDWVRTSSDPAAQLPEDLARRLEETASASA